MTDFLTIHLNRINQEQLAILQAAVRLSGDNLEILYQKGILSEDYVAAYADFLKELGNELTMVDDFFLLPLATLPVWKLIFSISIIFLVAVSLIVIPIIKAVILMSNAASCLCGDCIFEYVCPYAYTDNACKSNPDKGGEDQCM